MPVFIASIVILFCGALLVYLHYTYCRHKWRILDNYHRMDEDGNIVGWSTFYECTKCGYLKVKEKNDDSL